ncbi:MAG: teichuronic acid biosynthesis glycosyltransferase TuaH [Solirubrobacteraceae bacterium]|nr:teichuronic acid biosynthesis glycosyltransferase TuaH [Solirubrobacteraceae bacterium]
MSRGYVVYGTQPLDASWLTEHHLAHALAQRHDVLFVEPPVSPLTPLRAASPGGRAREVRQLLRRRPRVEGRLHALRPVALPPLSNARAREASAPLVRAQVRRAARAAGLDHPVALAAWGHAAALGGAGERLRLYLIKDWLQSRDGAALLGLDPAVVDAEVDAMCATADAICATSPALRRALAARGLDSVLLRHGFDAGSAARYDGAALPREYEGLPRPLLGFTGTVDARLDLELLGALADRFAGGTVVLVGPVSPRLGPAALDVLRRRPNVALLGPRPGPELAPYVSHLDCALLPYRSSEWLRHASPLKLWDYLYAGPPIVGSGCAALLEHSAPLVRFADSAPEFADAVQDALADPGTGRAQRRACALANTWEHRAHELDALVCEVGKKYESFSAPRPLIAQGLGN